MAGSESVVSLAGSFTILQTAVDSLCFGEAGSLTKTPVLCKNFSFCFEEVDVL